MPKVPTVPFWRKKKVIIVAVVILLVIGLGVTGMMLGWFRMNNAGNTDKPGGADIGASGFSPTIDEVQALNAKGDFEAAQTKTDEALKDANITAKERYYLYIQQGNIANDKKDYPAAIAAPRNVPDITAGQPIPAGYKGFVVTPESRQEARNWLSRAQQNDSYFGDIVERVSGISTCTFGRNF